MLGPVCTSGCLTNFQAGLVRVLVKRCRHELRLPVPGAAAVSPGLRLALNLDHVIVALGMRILVQAQVRVQTKMGVFCTLQYNNVRPPKIDISPIADTRINPPTLTFAMPRLDHRLQVNSQHQAHLRSCPALTHLLTASQSHYRSMPIHHGRQLAAILNGVKCGPN